MQYRRMLAPLVGVVALVLLCGCGYMRLLGHEIQHSVASIDFQSPVHSGTRVSGAGGVLMGRITGSAPAGQPIAVAAFSKRHSDSQRSQTIQLVDYSLLPKPGPYTLFVPDGDYRVLAFIDANQNFILEKDEFAGHYGLPTAVVVKSEQVVGNLDIQLNGQAVHWLDFPISLQKLPHRKMVEHSLEMGGCVDFENDAFTKKYASMGLWQPEAFISDIGIHLYAVKPCAPGKIPVLFIHGIGGSPRDWTYLSKTLDRRLFQPWFYYYPTGIRLSTAAELLHEKIEDLYDIHHFERLYVVAHSMGGLVARAFINCQIRDNDAAYIPIFISISTPWGGDRSARMGVDTAPVSVDSWKDVAAGSQFIENLYKTHLPNHLKFYLFFSYGGNKRFHWETNDGTVSLKSQLDPRSKADAFREIGFYENHMGILFSSATATQLNDILTGTRTVKSGDGVTSAAEPPADVKAPPRTPPAAAPSRVASETSNLQQNSPEEDPARKYIRMLQSIDSVKKREAARLVVRKRLKNPEIFDTAESELIQGYRTNLSDSRHVDAMAWMCNLLGASGDARYKATLEKVAQECRNRKIRRYARRNLRKLL